MPYYFLKYVKDYVLPFLRIFPAKLAISAGLAVCGICTASLNMMLQMEYQRSDKTTLSC